MASINKHLAKDLARSKAHSDAKKAAAPKEKLHSITVKPADGGFVVDTHKSMGDDDYPRSSQTSVHKNLASVKKHMMDTCGGED